MDKHTPGPWLCDAGDCGGDGPGYADIYTADETIIASFNPLIPGGTANAYLMAAAPDMFDALQDALASLEISGQSDYVTGRVRAAIEKARGVSHG